LGTEDLLSEIKKFYDKNGVKYEEVVFDFEGPKNIGLVASPTQANSLYIYSHDEYSFS
jgi:hypothetical protein